MYDTGAAPDGTPVHRWTYALPTIASGEYRLPQPVVSGDRVYAAWWTYDTSNHQQRLYLVTLDAATGAGPAGGPAAVTAIDAATASGRTFWFDILGDYTPTLAQVADGKPDAGRPVRQRGQHRLAHRRRASPTRPSRTA